MLHQLLTFVALSASAAQPLGPVPGSGYAEQVVSPQGVTFELVQPQEFEEHYPGLTGTAFVDGQEASAVFTYHTGRLWPANLITDKFYDGDYRPPITIELIGLIEIPETMPVKIWHAGGGVNGDTAELILGGRSLSIVGDDTVKNIVTTITIPAGIYVVQWNHVTAGTYQPHYLKFENAETGEPIECFNRGCSIPATDFSGPVMLVDVNNDPAEWGIIGEPSYWTTIDIVSTLVPPPQLTEHWRAEFANGVVQTYTLSHEGTVTVEAGIWQDTGTIEFGEGHLIIRFSQDRAERWTPVGDRMVIEHWFPASRLPTQAPVLGIAEMRIEPVQEAVYAPGTEEAFLLD